MARTGSANWAYKLGEGVKSVMKKKKKKDKLKTSRTKAIEKAAKQSGLTQSELDRFKHKSLREK